MAHPLDVQYTRRFGSGRRLTIVLKEDQIEALTPALRQRLFDAEAPLDPVALLRALTEIAELTDWPVQTVLGLEAR